MPRLRVEFLVAIAVLALGVAPADAGGVVHAYWHGHWGPHVFIGPGPFWYPYPYVGPPVVVQPASPAQVHAQPPMPAQPAWHSCGKPKGSSPDVSPCPGGWTQVAPTTKPWTP
ncbi:MAG TPA: hypothetical protein VKI64_04695 [Acidimicrobiales bacterium]|nr:MAG: hypothetical protein DME09_07535 [Candidatus Rokubacteria bacterium]HMC52040.1 hypothetical protein [Acidimicrobiales bacterium]